MRLSRPDGLSWMEYRWGFFLVLLLSLAAAAACLSWIRLSEKPLTGVDLTPALHPEQWSFSLGDGTSLAPGPDGNLDVAAGETVYCAAVLPELGAQSPLSIAAGSAEITVLLDGALVSDPSGRFTPGGGLLPAPAGAVRLQRAL